MIICDECGVFEIPEGSSACRVCSSITSGFPDDFMTPLEFDSFRHRMLKKERERCEREKREGSFDRKALSTQQEAMARVMRERQIGNYAGPLTACKACKKILSHSERAKYGCYACYKAHMWSLTTTGLPYIPKVEQQLPVVVKGTLTRTF